MGREGAQLHELCGRCVKAGFNDGTCVYCGQAIEGKHEHDHAPVPKRHGGEQIMPCCVACHNAKDRLGRAFWDGEVLRSAFEDCGTGGRILIASMIAHWHDYEERRRALEGQEGG